MKELVLYIQSSPTGLTEKELLEKFPSLCKKTLSQKLHKLLERKMISLENGPPLLYKKPCTDNTQEKKLIQTTLKEHKGVTVRELRLKTKIPQNLLIKLLKKLENDMVIQSFKNFKTNLKVYMLYGEQPLDTITGGIFFTEGNIDTEFVAQLINVIHGFLSTYKLRSYAEFPTVEDIHTFITEANILNDEINTADIKKILKIMVYDEIVQELEYEDKMLYRVVKDVI